MNRKEYLKKWREDNKEHIQNYKKEYAKTHDSSFKKLQDKYKQLQQKNKQLKERYSKLEEKYFANVPCCNENDCDLYRDYMKLKDNWNKLKEYIRETKFKEFEKSYGKRYGKTFTQAEIIVCNMILDKMQELERSDSNE